MEIAPYNLLIWLSLHAVTFSISLQRWQKMKKGDSSMLRGVTNNKVQLAYKWCVAFSPQSIKCDFWEYSHALPAEAKHVHHSDFPPSQYTSFPLKC